MTFRRVGVAVLVAVVGSVMAIGTLGVAGIVARLAPDPAVSVPSGRLDPVSSPPSGTPAADPAFAEECSGPALGHAWRPLHGPDDPGFGLDSDFFGDVRQVSVENGLCVIVAERSETPSGRPYGSAAISTRGTFSQRYGTFEARVRYAAGHGLWPAFWLLEDRDVVSSPPEIDIFEAYPGASEPRTPNSISSTLHHAGGSHTFTHDHGSDLTLDFHVHRLVWTPGLLVFFIDGVETGRITADVPDVAMYPILNLAVGANGFRANASTPARATLEIDYVRIWAP